jgi:hypothetical protein
MASLESLRKRIRVQAERANVWIVSTIFLRVMGKPVGQGDKVTVYFPPTGVKP